MKLILKDKKKDTEDVSSFVFESQVPISWKAGQFMQYIIERKNPDDRGVSRFFTISSAPFEKSIVITTRFNKDKSSTFKEDLVNLELDTSVEAMGPWGDFILDYTNKDQGLVFIAGGIGITPFRSILLDIDHNKYPINATLLYFNNTEEFPCKNELDNIKNKKLLRVLYSTDKFSENHINKIESYKDKKYYVSGPKGFVDLVIDKLHSLDIDNIKKDFFPGY
jgi:ferredoxin-NADP reductase